MALCWTSSPSLISQWAIALPSTMLKLCFAASLKSGRLPILSVTTLFTKLNRKHVQFLSKIVTVIKQYAQSTYVICEIWFLRFLLKFPRFLFKGIVKLGIEGQNSFYSEHQSLRTLLSARSLLKNVLYINVSIMVHF